MPCGRRSSVRASRTISPGAFEPFRHVFPVSRHARAHHARGLRREHGLGDLVDRFVVRESDRWSLATYLFPSNATQAARIQDVVNSMDSSQTTGLALVVNRESREASAAVHQGIGDRNRSSWPWSCGVSRLAAVPLRTASDADWRLTWAAGALAIAGVELDLFAVFAVVTFVGTGWTTASIWCIGITNTAMRERATAELAPVILSAAGITLGGYGTLIWSSYLRFGRLASFRRPARSRSPPLRCSCCLPCCRANRGVLLPKPHTTRPAHRRHDTRHQDRCRHPGLERGRFDRAGRRGPSRLG
jgi:hypothetical protein